MTLVPILFLSEWVQSPPYLYKLQCCVLNLRIRVFEVKSKNFKDVDLGILLLIVFCQYFLCLSCTKSLKQVVVVTTE